MNNNSKRRLLLVDDERVVLATLGIGLTKAGYIVSTADSVDEAEDILAGGERPDLAILDVRMPVRSGLELAERMNSFDYIPFILLTANCDQEIIEQASRSGALGYLVKPVVTRELVPAIEQALACANDFRGLRDKERQLQSALDGERAISVAIGITMMQYRLSHKAAFELLRNTARSQECKLAVLATEVCKTCEIMNLGANEKPP